MTILGTTHEVDLTGDQPRVDGAPVRAELARVPGTAVRHLLVDDRSHTLVAARGAERHRWDIHLDGHRLEVDVVDERTRAIRAMTGAGGVARGPQPVRAPMPGLVVRLEVELGQRVEAGQGVVIMEAMKMENELKAESAGVVSRLLAEAGAAVEKGAVLVEFAEPELEE